MATVNGVEIQVGDFVKTNGWGAWGEGHVESIDGDLLRIGYGSKATPKHLRLHAAGRGVSVDDVQEVWTRKQVVNESVFTMSPDKSMKVVSREFEWVQLV